MDDKHNKNNEPQFRALYLGALPHTAVSHALGQPMPKGVVLFTKGAQLHSWQRHKTDFYRYQAFLSQTIASPTFIGQSPHQLDGFEHVLEVPTEDISVLVAITLRPSNGGVYYVKSCYLLSKSTVEARVRKKRLVRAMGNER